MVQASAWNPRLLFSFFCYSFPQAQPQAVRDLLCKKIFASDLLSGISFSINQYVTQKIRLFII